jgi:hypothetical protein
MEHNSSITELIKILGSHGIGWLLLGLGLFGLFLIIYKRILSIPKVQDSIAFWFTQKAYRITKDKLKKHQLLISQPVLRSKIDNISFDHAPLKTDIFKTFFKVKLTGDIQKIKEFLKRDFKKISKEELFTQQTNLLEGLKETFNNEIIPALNELCERELSKSTSFEFANRYASDCSRQIFRHVMYSENGYEQARNKRMEVLIEYTALIRDSIAFDNNNERNYHFLDILNSLISQAILRAEQDFKDFNGEIENILSRYIKKYKSNK